MGKHDTKKKRNTAAQKAEMVLAMLKDESQVAQIAAQYGVHPSQIYRWKNLAIERFAHLFEEEARQPQQLQQLQQELQQLYAEIGQLTLQLNWLKKKSGLRPPPTGAGRHD